MAFVRTPELTIEPMMVSDSFLLVSQEDYRHASSHSALLPILIGQTA